MINGVKIRISRLQDLNRDVRSQLYKLTRRRFSIMKRWLNRIARGSNIDLFVAVAYHGQSCIGWALAVMQTYNYCYQKRVRCIQMMVYITPTLRSNGYASKLLIKLESFMRKFVYNTPFYAFPTDKAGYALFESLGYNEFKNNYGSQTLIKP